MTGKKLEVEEIELTGTIGYVSDGRRRSGHWIMLKDQGGYYRQEISEDQYDRLNQYDRQSERAAAYYREG